METQFAQRPDNLYRDGVNTQPVHTSAVSWCAVFAGAVASAALSLILLLLGTGFGLTLISPWSNDGISGTTFGVSSIVGITLISLAASALGGYLAGRLRTRWLNTHIDEVYFRDTAHGFLSWAVATLGTAALLTSVISGIVGGGVKAGAAIAGGAATVTGSAIAGGTATTLMNNNGESDITLSYLLDALLRSTNDNPTANTPPVETENLNPENSFDTAPSTTPFTTPAPTSNRNSLQSDTTKIELTRIFLHAVATDSFPQEDIQYAGQLVAQATGVDQQTAEKRVTDSFSTLRKNIEDAETTMREAADKAREVSAYTSLWLFISLLSGAFVASLMAVYGGRKRDL